LLNGFPVRYRFCVLAEAGGLRRLPDGNHRFVSRNQSICSATDRTESPFLASVFFLKLGEFGDEDFQFALLSADGFLLGGKVAVNDKMLGNEVASPTLINFITLLVGLNDSISLRLPAVGGDQITVVLHCLSPVIHQVLVNVVFINQLLASVMSQQVFR
jgi:hypothetical protein